MNRETKTITLPVSKAEVKIVSVLTWGEKERIQSVLVEGTKISAVGIAGYDMHALSEAKYKALETCIKEIKQGGQAVPFSREWMDALPVQDGDMLTEAVDALFPKKPDQSLT